MVLTICRWVEKEKRSCTRGQLIPKERCLD